MDAISSLGGIPINLEKTNIDYSIGASNKCLHSFPGIAKKYLLKKYKHSNLLV